jgi:hypothetical protein
LNLNENDARTPGRRAASAWGRADLARRVARLPIPEDARARVARFVEEEIERARGAWLREAAPLAGLECPKCSAPIEDDLRKRRRDEEIVETLRGLGGGTLSAEQLEKVFQQASSPRAGG